MRSGVAWSTVVSRFADVRLGRCCSAAQVPGAKAEERSDHKAVAEKRPDVQDSGKDSGCPTNTNARGSDPPLSVTRLHGCVC